MLRVALLTAILTAAGTAAEPGNFLLRVYGKLLLLQPDGTQRVLADRVNNAAFSPDGSYVAFTDESGGLFVLPVSGSAAAVEITRLPAGAHFEEIGWAPAGSILAWQAIVPGKSDDLFAIPFPLTGEGPRNLGHWYQNFSFSPDGKNIVHAVNDVKDRGLEILELATGKRTLLHRTKNIVWDAFYSPNGQFIAYRMTIRDPNTPDDEPDCTPPTLGLFVYSVSERRAFRVKARNAAPDLDNISAYSWSPDSSRLGLITGTTDCDFPGETAIAFVTGVDSKRQSRASDSIRSLDPVFAPDGGALAYVDVSDLPAKLMRYDLKTGARTLMWKAPQDDNYFRVLGWK